MQLVSATVTGCGQKYGIKENIGSLCSACRIWHLYIGHVERTGDVSKFLEVFINGEFMREVWIHFKGHKEGSTDLRRGCIVATYQWVQRRLHWVCS